MNNLDTIGQHMKSIPGWTTNIEEISNGVFRVILTDEYGRKAEVIDNASDETIERAISDAFDIEKQISKNWNLFLFNLCIAAINNKNIVNKEYNDKAFGSWYIESEENRLIYDGKDNGLIFQTKIGGDWTDKIVITKDGLKYLNFVEQIRNI